MYVFCVKQFKYVSLNLIRYKHTGLQNRMEVEEVIATMKNKLNYYNAQWQVYKHTFKKDQHTI